MAACGIGIYEYSPRHFRAQFEYTSMTTDLYVSSTSPSRRCGIGVGRHTDGRPQRDSECARHALQDVQLLVSEESKISEFSKYIHEDMDSSPVYVSS